MPLKSVTPVTIHLASGITGQSDRKLPPAKKTRERERRGDKKRREEKKKKRREDGDVWRADESCGVA